MEKGKRDQGKLITVLRKGIRNRILSLLALVSLSPALQGQCVKSNTVFTGGEEAVYSVSYNWGPVWVNAGVVTFSASFETYHGIPAWHLKSTGKTFPSYDLLFKVRDYYDSWVDTSTFRSIGFQRYIYEGGYTLVNTLAFDYARQKVYSNTKTNNNSVRTDTLKLLPCTFDMLTAVYFTRLQDLSSLKPNEKKQVALIIDDCYYIIYIRSLGKEVVENTDGKKYRCIKFAAKMVTGTIFRGDEDVLVWVTDDANKIPIRVEAKILVGTVKAFLKEVKGIRNPMTTLIKE